jgi:hypothetical protein
MAAGQPRKVFVNLAVEDLGRSVDFFTKLGFTFDPRFTDDSATCLVLSDEAYVMLLVAKRFQDFTTRQITDSRTHRGHHRRIGGQPGRSGRAGPDSAGVRWIRGQRPHGPRLHVHVELPRPRRAPVGGSLDGSGRTEVGNRDPGAALRPSPTGRTSRR